MARGIENLMILAVVVALAAGGFSMLKSAGSPAGQAIAGGFANLNKALSNK